MKVKKLAIAAVGLLSVVSVPTARATCNAFLVCWATQHQTGGCPTSPQCNGQACTMYTFDQGGCIVVPVYFCNVEDRSRTATMRTGNCVQSSYGCGCDGTDTTVTITVHTC
jgi:hypothetical protein